MLIFSKRQTPPSKSNQLAIPCGLAARLGAGVREANLFRLLKVTGILKNIFLICDESVFSAAVLAILYKTD